MTEFYYQTIILAELWEEYKDVDTFQEFYYINEIGLPLAWAVNQGLCQPSIEGINYIEHTFKNLMLWYEIEDTGFETLDEVMDAEENTRLNKKGVK